MSVFEQLFNSSVLDVSIPNSSLEYPPVIPPEAWLKKLQGGTLERTQAFFDEQLQFYLTLRLDHVVDEPSEAEHPPEELLRFLAHIQVSFEATYISPVATSPGLFKENKLLAAPKLSSSKAKGRPSSTHPSIFPPNTPNPTPATSDNDTRYTQSEGTPLLASIWGGEKPTNSSDAFSLLWSETDQVWVAVYRLALTVSFLRLPVPDPLLCLTVSATLREKPTNIKHPKHPLGVYLKSVGGIPELSDAPLPSLGGQDTQEDLLLDLEVNLLEGLLSGPTFSSSKISLNSSRLGPVSRRKLFSLPPTQTVVTSQIPTKTTRVSHPTLRKSFRKTLRTVSGFRVRMRTVFVPFVLLPSSSHTLFVDEEEDERERREAGSEERTVILCVEIENSGESGNEVGFAVENVDVHIGGEGATITLISCGDEHKPHGKLPPSSFPIRVGAMEQHNLLYAVSFNESPGELENFSLRSYGNPSKVDIQRTVSIVVNGRPFLQPPKDQELGVQSYPTHIFPSRWNCVLDLSPQQKRDRLGSLEAPVNEVLPEPASPFPVSFGPKSIQLPSSSSGTSQPTTPPIASKHFTSPAGIGGRFMQPPRTASPLNPHRESRDSSTMATASAGAPSKMSFNPPSISVQIPRSPTSYDPVSTPGDSSATTSPYTHNHPPMTPAYPAFPTNSTLQGPTQTQVAINSHFTGNTGPSVEIRRERGFRAGGKVGTPTTPGPVISSSQGQQEKIVGNYRDSIYSEPKSTLGEPIIVSVSLLPLSGGREKIYALETFVLDVFVFNQSSWTRRFELSCPEKKRRSQGIDKIGEHLSSSKEPNGRQGAGILPLDNRIRIGPLLPNTCQSVRMEFIAVSPGIHSVDALILTDVMSGYSMGLRSVADIAVHEREDSDSDEEQESS